MSNIETFPSHDARGQCRLQVFFVRRNFQIQRQKALHFECDANTDRYSNENPNMPDSANADCLPTALPPGKRNRGSGRQCAKQTKYAPGLDTLDLVSSSGVI